MLEMSLLAMEAQSNTSIQIFLLVQPAHYVVLKITSRNQGSQPPNATIIP